MQQTNQGGSTFLVDRLLVIDAYEIKQQHADDSDPQNVKSQSKIIEKWAGTQIGYDVRNDSDLTKKEGCDVEPDLVISIL